LDVTFANEELGRRTVVVVGKRKDVPFYAPFSDILNWRIGVAVDVGAVIGKAFIASRIISTLMPGQSAQGSVPV